MRTPSRRRRLALAPLLLLAACSSGETAQAPESQPSEAASSFVPPDGPPDGVEVVDLDDGAVGLTAVGDEVWAVLPEAGAVRDPGGTLHPVGEVPLRAVTTPQGIWVSVFGASALARIDPRTGEVDRRVRLRPAGEPEGLAFDGTSVWVVDQENEQVVALDPATGRAGTRVDVGRAPRLVTSGPSGVFVSDFDGRSVTRVADGQPLTHESGDCLTPQGLAEAGSLLWVACTLDGRVVGLDPTTLEQQVELPDLPYADFVVADGDLVHVVGQQGPTVWTIDTGRREVVDELVLDDAPPTDANVAAVLAGDRLVVSHPGTRRLYEVPLDLLAP